jgi:hypothetical protein
LKNGLQKRSRSFRSDQRIRRLRIAVCFLLLVLVGALLPASSLAAGKKRLRPEELHGSWISTITGEAGNVIVYQLFRPDGSYRSNVIATGEPTVISFDGKWSIQGRNVLIKIKESNSPVFLPGNESLLLRDVRVIDAQMHYEDVAGDEYEQRRPTEEEEQNLKDFLRKPPAEMMSRRPVV